jgi:hypothetical protein
LSNRVALTSIILLAMSYPTHAQSNRGDPAQLAQMERAFQEAGFYLVAAQCLTAAGQREQVRGMGQSILQDARGRISDPYVVGRFDAQMELADEIIKDRFSDRQSKACEEARSELLTRLLAMVDRGGQAPRSHP